MTTQSVTIMSDTIVKLPRALAPRVEGCDWFLACDKTGRVIEFATSEPLTRGARLLRTVDVRAVR